MTKDRSTHHPALTGLLSGDQEASAWLGILHEEAVVRPATAAVLWSLPEAEARQVLQRLQVAGLVLPADDKGYRLDSAMQEEAKQRLAERMPLPESHARLLEAYRAQTRDNLWHTLPNDGYIHEHLTWHMAQVGWEDEIHAMLREETPEGHNAWYKTRLGQGQPDGYEQDIARARQLADKRGDVGLQCRYALISASTSSTHDERLPALLDRLVETGIWSPEQGLAYACRLPDATKRAQALAQLAPLLPASLYADALAAVRQIEDGEARARALADLVSHLPALAGISLYLEILDAARELQDLSGQVSVMSSAQAEILSGLASRLAEGPGAHLMAEVLDQARSIEYPPTRWRTLVALVPHLSERSGSRVLEEALAGARRDGLHLGVVSEFSAVAPYLSEPQRAQLLMDELTTPRGFQARSYAVYVEANPTVSMVDVAGLANGLPGRLLRRALVAARDVKEAGDRAEALAALAPHLSGGLRENALREALAAAREVSYHLDRARVLVAVARALPEAEQVPVLEEALATAWQIGDETAQLPVAEQAEQKREMIWLLASLGTRFPEPRRSQVLAKALHLARESEPAFERVAALNAVAHHLSEPLAGQVCEEALIAARQIEDERERSIHLYFWGYDGDLPDSLWTEVLLMARGIEDDEKRARVLVELPPRLPEPERTQVLEEALAAIWRIESEEQRVIYLESLARHLPRPMLERVLTDRWSIGDGEVRNQALARLASHLPEAQRESILAEALADMEARDAWQHLDDLVPHLPESLLEQALAAARSLDHGVIRARTLVALAPRMPAPEQAQVLKEALEAMTPWDLGLPGLIHGLLEATTRLPGPERRQILAKVLDLAAQIPYERDHIQVLLEAAAYLPQSEKEQALSEALDLAGGLASLKAWELMLEKPALYALDPLEEAWQKELLAVAQRSDQDAPDRVETWTRLAPHLSGPYRTKLLEEALATARKMKKPRFRARGLLQVAAHLTEPKREEAIQEALATAQETELGVWDWATLLLQAGAIQEALAAARGIEDPNTRAMSLADLIPHLPDAQRSGVVEEAWAATREDDDWEGPVYALLKLAPHLPKPQRARALVKVVVEGWWWGDYQAQARLAVPLAALPPVYLHPAWNEILPRMAAGTRTELLSGIHALTPVIVSLGGSEAAAEIFCAIRDVGRWWP